MLEPNVSQPSATVNDHQRPQATTSDHQSSPIEDRLAEAFDHLKAAYERQFLFHGRKYDFAMPEAQLLIECDGYDYHKTPEQMDKDTRRDREASHYGWRVERFTGSQINRSAIVCALEAIHIRDIQISILNLAVSKEMCGEYAWPSTMTN